MAVSKRNTNIFQATDGHQLAIDMLREIHEQWLAREDGVPDDQVGDLWRRDDSAVLRRYLKTVGASRSPALEAGFFAVLTDFIGGTLDGVVPELEFYEHDRAH